MITRAWVASLHEEASMRLESGEDAQYILEDILRRLEEVANLSRMEKAEIRWRGNE